MMKKTILLPASAALLLAMTAITTAATQSATPQNPPIATTPHLDHMATARELYGSGQWRAARREFERAPQTPETAAMAAICAARDGDPAAGAIISNVLADHPQTLHKNFLRYLAGVVEHRKGDYTAAAQIFDGVDAWQLPAEERDEHHFLRGHTFFTTGDEGKARVDFLRIPEGTPFRPHADYYMAYMEYAAGHYVSAKNRFQSLADVPAYSSLVPYYLFQIEFSEGNYRYVTDHAAPLAAATAMPRRAELTAMAAQGWFRLGDWRQALAEMKAYRALGGEMGRAENYMMGYSSYREGLWDDAQAHLTLATGADDSLSQNASYHLADALLKLGDKARAMQSFSIAAASTHDGAITEDALFNYAKLLYELGGGRFNESLNVLNRYLGRYPSSPRAHEAREYLIAAYYNSHDYDAAWEAIEAHPDPDNNVLSARQKIAYFRALRLWNATRDTSDPDAAAKALELLELASRGRYNAKYTALANFWQGEIRYSREQYAEAIPLYESYLRTSPTTEHENVMARYNLGYAAFNLGKWDAAEGRFNDFLERHTPRDSYRADALNRLGDIHFARRAWWRAIESYDAAAALQTPERYYSAWQRAMMLGHAGRPERKIASLQAIIAAGEGPWVERAEYELGRTYISQGNYAQGATTLDRFTQHYPTSPLHREALSNLALAHLNMGERALAMKYYKMIVTAAPSSPESRDALEAIRGLYVDGGDVDGYFAYAGEAGVADASSRDSLAFVAAERAYLSGDGARASTALEGYLTSNPQGCHKATALGYLAGLQATAGRHAEAADTWYKLAEATSDDAAKTKALDSWVASIIAAKDADRTVRMADEALAKRSLLSERSLTAALFAKAGVLRERGDGAAATDIYRSLATDVHTPEGAESAWRVIDHLWASGDDAAAEKAVFDLSDSATPHGYWLGKAFLTLGDIYARAGDNFQARATYQSIVDGYSPADDGIVAAARERIANLK